MKHFSLLNVNPIFSVPTDGVKGKTWGPSSGGHVLSSLGTNPPTGPKPRPSIPEERWSKSASNLEKSPKNKPGLPSVTSVPEMGKIFVNKHLKTFCEILINKRHVIVKQVFLLPIVNLNFNRKMKMATRQ